MAIAWYDARPYDLRHSFASLLLHEGRSVMYVARQLGRAAGLTLSAYGHVIDELDDSPQIPAEDAIRAAGSGSRVTAVSQEEQHASCRSCCRAQNLHVCRSSVEWAVLGSNQRPPTCKIRPGSADKSAEGAKPSLSEPDWGRTQRPRPPIAFWRHRTWV